MVPAEPEWFLTPKTVQSDGEFSTGMVPAEPEGFGHPESRPILHWPTGMSTGMMTKTREKKIKKKY